MTHSTGCVSTSEPGFLNLREPLLTEIDKKTHKIGTSILKDLITAISRSKLIKPILGSALTFSILTFLTSPPGWLIIAATVSSFAIPFLLQCSKKGWQRFTFELTTIIRLCKKKNYHRIFTNKTTQASIFLGAMPNRLRSTGEELINQHKVSAVLSLNEPWETEARGLSFPYTEKWGQLNAQYKGYEVKDHTLLDIATLHKAADDIHNWIQKEKNVYVHCRAGVGRSAMAVFAYLVKYENMTVNQAIIQITKNRPSATIGKEKKRARLEEFYQDCQNLKQSNI